MPSEDNKNDEWMTPKDHSAKNHVYRCRSKKELANEALMKMWYGNEMGILEIEQHQKKERSINEVMDNLLDSWKQSDRKQLRHIIEHWQSIIGIEYAKSTRPTRINNKVLEVEVFNQAVKFKLNMVKNIVVKEIIDKIDLEITDVKFITGGQSTARPN